MHHFCLLAHSQVLGSDLEHTMVTACLWVAFALSVLILMYYMWHTYLGTCGWEVRTVPAPAPLGAMMAVLTTWPCSATNHISLTSLTLYAAGGLRCHN